MVANIRKVMIFVFLVVVSFEGHAAEILRGLSSDTKENSIDFEVDLAAPVEYVKHFPTRRGKILQIQIRLTGLDEAQLKRRESLQPPDGNTLLRDVIYEGNVRGGPFVVLRFSRVVSFSVAGAGENGLLISVEKDDQIAAETTEQTPPPVAQPKPGDDKAAILMRDARQALTRGENEKAVLLFTQLLEMPDHEFRQDAKEYLGVARERNGQLEMAKAVYEQYLQQFPEGPKSSTVKQRLMALNARLSRPKPALREGRRQTAVALRRRDTFGRFSQLYFNALTSTESNTTEHSRNLLMSFVDVTSRFRDDQQETRLVFSGSNEWDFLNDDPTQSDAQNRIRSAYVDYKGRSNGLSAIFGRQSAGSGGVLGRFDGTVVGYRVKPKLQVNGVIGMPVDYSDPNKIQANKPMVGGRVDFLETIKNLNWSAYAIKQNVDGITERMAIGGDTRYFKNQNSFFGVVDYDVSFKVLNIFTVHGGWKYDANTKFDIHYDHRRSPIILTSNALVGIPNIAATDASVLGVTSDQLRVLQGNLTIEQMREFMSEETIRNRALANTGRSDLFTLGVTRDINKDLQFNGNLSASRYASTSPVITLQNEFGPDEEIEVASSDVTLTGQLIARNYWLPQDVIVGALRLSNTSTDKRISLSLIGRAPFRQKWRGDARVRFDYSKANSADRWDEFKVSPAFKGEYVWNRHMSVEGELGVENVQTTQVNADYTWTYVNLGWRYTY